MLHRRKLIGAGLAGTAALACACHARGLQRSIGCVLKHEDAHRIFAKKTAPPQVVAPGEDVIIAHTHNRDFDYALAQSLGKISALFGVSPGFAFYDDSESSNAYATQAVRMDRADGTVLFGTTLLAETMRQHDSPEVAVVTICAHEFGHILQFKYGLEERAQNGARGCKRLELQADFFAGYFVGTRRRERPNFPAAVAAMAQYNVGDTDFRSPEHHGTPDERGAAVSLGYQVAYRDNRSLAEAIQISLNYVQRL